MDRSLVRGMIFFEGGSDKSHRNFERRLQGERLRCDIPIYILQTAAAPIPASIRNISDGGLYIVLIQRTEIMQFIDVVDARDGEIYRVKCHWQRGRSIGVSFVGSKLRIDIKKFDSSSKP
ncbi:hypothetical protein FHR71_005490 [Methylobacterium sp. RAS18]|nr:hypothetical protein [Methylobacterium sp. RAS18]